MEKILIILLVFCLKANAQNNAPVQLPVYPSFTQMASVFFQHYTLPEVYPKEYYFAKEPNGWHILLVDRNNKFGDRQVIEDYLFWDRSKKSYLSLTLPKNDPSEVANIPVAYDTWENKYFSSISPYYGYVGWDADVIKDYGSLQNLSDTLLNALARAYSSYAENLLSNNTGLSDTKVRFNLTVSLNSLNQEQLETYRKYEHLSIETYKKLWKLNPKFENFVGEGYLVYSNEIMNAFLTLRYFQNEVEAHKELNQTIYDPFFIAMAKNYLASCDSNAIIFTNGDSDTYPLLYIQEKEGFRTDVLVINVSLLGSGRYMNHLFCKIGQSDPLSVYLDKNLYINNARQYVIINKSKGDEEPIDVKDMLIQINSADTSKKYKLNNEYVDYIKTTHLRVNVDKSNAISHKIVGSDESDYIQPQMEWMLNRSSAFFQNDLAILDIFSSSNFQRPIYFAITVADDSYLGLEQYFQLEGLAYKLVPIKYAIKNNEIGGINTARLFNKLKNKFYYADLNNDIVALSENHKRLICNYRAQFGRLATVLINENKPDSAENILDLCLQKFPYTKAPLDYSSISHAECYYKLKKDSIANLLVSLIFNKYSKDMDAYLKLNSQNKEEEYNKNLALYILNKLSTLTEMYNQGKFGETIRMRYENYRKILNPEPIF
jgi:hypothetical protein